MRKLFAIALLCLGLTIPNLHAQLPVGKIKRATDKVKSKTRGSDSDEGGDSEPANMTSAAKMEASPATSEIRAYRNALSFAWDDVKKMPGGRPPMMTELKAKLDLIKEKDPNWSEWDKDLADYEEIKAKYDFNTELYAFRDQLDGRLRSIDFFQDKPGSYASYAERLDRRTYAKLKADIAASQVAEEAQLQERIAKIDAFFADKLGPVREAAIEDITESYVKGDKWVSSYRKSPEFLEWFQDRYSPEDAIEYMDKARAVCDIMPAFFEDVSDFEAWRGKIDARQQDMKDYFENGQYAADQAAYRARVIEARRVSKNVKTDAAISGLVKREVGAQDVGTVIRISLVSDWYVSKNDYDLPTEKWMDVEAVVRNDDGCFIVEGRVHRTYEGGGNYGAAWYGNTSSKLYEMNCANVNK